MGWIRENTNVGSAMSLRSCRKPWRSRVFLSITLVTGLLGFSIPSKADDTNLAETKYKQGFEDMKAGKYVTGCPALEESYRLAPDKLGTLFTLAFCESQWGRLATADRWLQEYLRLYDALPSEQQTAHLAKNRPKLATEERARIREDIPMLTLVVASNVPPGTVIRLNTTVVNSKKLGIAMPIDPGEHRVSFQVPGSALQEHKITVRKGEQRSLTLKIAERPAQEPGKATSATVYEPVFELEPGLTTSSGVSNSLEPKPPNAVERLGPKNELATAEPVPPEDADTAEASLNAYEMGAIVSGGAGLAGLAIGGLLGGLAIGTGSTVKANCGQAIDKSDPSTCNTTGLSASQDLKHLAVGSNIAFIAGGIALAAGVTMYILAPNSSDPKTPQAGKRPRPSLQAGILSTTPTRLVVGAQGSF